MQSTLKLICLLLIMPLYGWGQTIKNKSRIKGHWLIDSVITISSYKNDTMSRWTHPRGPLLPNTIVEFNKDQMINVWGGGKIQEYHIVKDTLFYEVRRLKQSLVILFLNADRFVWVYSNRYDGRRTIAFMQKVRVEEKNGVSIINHGQPTERVTYKELPPPKIPDTNVTSPTDRDQATPNTGLDYYIKKLQESVVSRIGQEKYNEWIDTTHVHYFKRRNSPEDVAVTYRFVFNDSLKDPSEPHPSQYNLVFKITDNGMVGCKSYPVTDRLFPARRYGNIIGKVKENLPDCSKHPDKCNFISYETAKALAVQSVKAYKQDKGKGSGNLKFNRSRHSFEWIFTFRGESIDCGGESSISYTRLCYFKFTVRINANSGRIISVDKSREETRIKL